MSLGLYSLALPSLGLMYGRPRTNYGFVMFDYSPNWQSGIKERLSWRTGIFESKNGTEQRQAKRDYPRRNLRYDLLLHGAKLAEVDSLYYGSPTLELAVPSWVDFASLTSPASAGSERLFLSTAFRGFVAGGFILIYSSSTKQEIAQVSSVSSEDLLLNETTFFSWDEGARVYPLNFMELELPFRYKRLSAALAAPEISLNQKGANFSMNLPAVSAPETYQSREVFSFKHNWIDGADREIQILLDALDAEVGLFRNLVRGKHSTQVFPVKVLLSSRAEIDAFRGFLARVKGRFASFWAPAQSQDFKLISPAASDSRVLVCEGLAFPLYTGLAKGKNHVRIQLRSGQVLYREIAETDLQSGNTQLTLSTPLGVALELDNVKKIDTLFKARLASDDVDLLWHTPSTVECTLTFRSLI